MKTLYVNYLLIKYYPYLYIKYYKPKYKEGRVMRIFTLFITLLISSISFANRIYLNNDFKKTSKGKAAYYREISNSDNKAYHIKDYTITGVLIREGSFKDKQSKIKHGEIKEYYSWGNIAYISNYHDNILDGKRTSYYSTGEIKREEYFSQGELERGTCYDKAGKELKFFPSIEMPKFNHNGEDLETYLSKNLFYPSEAYQKGKEGEVLVSFKVRTTGEVSSVRILESSNILFNKAAKDLIKQTNHKWHMGRYENVPSDVTMTLPIVFSLNK
ncbi:TonB family protein [Halosquirtibacter xylanolyticus]|uniref:energy transducer TonB n=1 Tax=Halosquirtibacter xylanolyticus TaxID=3374599 RepID=UPI003749643A|nr:TonB family protein [Prolixibacteraceae bacterium]